MHKYNLKDQLLTGDFAFACKSPQLQSLLVFKEQSPIAPVELPQRNDEGRQHFLINVTLDGAYIIHSALLQLF